MDVEDMLDELEGDRNERKKGVPPKRKKKPAAGGSAPDLDIDSVWR